MSSESIKVAIIGGSGEIGRAALIRALEEDKRVELLIANSEMTLEEIADKVQEFSKELIEIEEQKKDRIRLVESISMIGDLHWEPPCEFNTRSMVETPHWLQHGNKRSVYKCK